MSESVLYIVGIWLWGALTAFLSFEIAAREGDYLPLTAKDRFTHIFVAIIWPIWNIILGVVYIWNKFVALLVGNGKNKVL